jgi:hypothetical protein
VRELPTAPAEILRSEHSIEVAGMEVRSLGLSSFGDPIALQLLRSTVMSFGIYLIGYIILIVGLAMGANLLHMPPRWIGVGVVILVGLGVTTGVTATRNRDSSS